jgi:DNA-binding NarL/FixJ family response regulator
MKRLIVVADNPLIAGAIGSALRNSDTLQLLGYLDPANATAARIRQAAADVVLVDESDDPEPAVALIRALKETSRDDQVVIMLTMRMEGAWLQRTLDAGADGALSKALHPAALGTLIREVVSGHIMHSPTAIHRPAMPSLELSTEHSSLTDREREILHMVAAGATNAEIARGLWITQQTVKFHVSNIYRKLGVANRTEACHYAHVNRLIAPRDPASGPATESAALSIAS